MDLENNKTDLNTSSSSSEDLSIDYVSEDLPPYQVIEPLTPEERLKIVKMFKTVIISITILAVFLFLITYFFL